MSVTKIITLTNKGNAAGPYYQVSCSNDCVTYGPCQTTSSIYLPTIGSTANVNIYDTTTCIKLVNYNTECNNSQVHNFTASGSTTTTSTTAAPTTTTTTLADTLKQYRFEGATGTTVNYKNKNNITETINMNSIWPIIVCAYTNTISTTGSVNVILKNNFCPGCVTMHLVATSANSAWASWENYDGAPIQASWGTTQTEDAYYSITSGSFLETYDPTNKLTETFSNCTTTTTTAARIYYYYRYTLDASCTPSNATLYYSYNVYANGYYNIDGIVYELTAEPADYTTLQITSATPASCTPSAATLNWTYSVTGAPTSNYMYLYVNGSIVETRSNTSSGTYSVNIGDVIYVGLGASGCGGGVPKANVYTSGIISDASCATGTTTLDTYSYTVVSGDAGNVLHLDSFAACDGGCL
jgi:hypothetical protein